MRPASQGSRWRRCSRRSVAFACAWLAFAAATGTAQAALPTALGDLNADGRLSVADAVLLAAHLRGTPSLAPALRAFADLDGNDATDAADLDACVAAALDGGPPPPFALPPTTFTSSPGHGEGEVSATREIIIRFTYPLASDELVTASDVAATFGGAPLAATRRLSPDRTTLTLFPAAPLPEASRIRVTVSGDQLTDAAGRAVDADRNGVPGGTGTFDFDTLAVVTLPDTSVCGRVFASQLAEGGPGTSVNVPLEGVTIRVDGAEDLLFAVTDELGSYCLEPAPVGTFFVHVDGRTAVADVPAGAFYPSVGKPFASIASQEVVMGDIFLPLVSADAFQPVSLTQDTVIPMPASALASFPELEGTTITVPAGSLVHPDGSPGTMAGIAPVPADRLPGKLPPSLQFPLVITVQADASNFDVPAPACFPNLPQPDTGQPLEPGSKTTLWSFDHDAGRWEAVGSMTIAADGRLGCTDPGVGILAPGWHGMRSGKTLRNGRIRLGFDDEDEDPDYEPPPTECPDGRPLKCCKTSTPGQAVASSKTDPVNLFSGELVLTEIDLRIPGRGLDFVWSRTYRSRVRIATEMGIGWDWSYDIRIEPEGPDLRLHDGASRRDVYRRQPDGTWSRGGFFRELQRLGDGSHVLTWPDGGRWELLPLDGRPEAGRIAAVVDRNGNALRFAYDAAGRLVTVTDTLDRDITIGYDPRGYIETVTDFTGRVVRYEHVQAGDPSGSPGDLKSCAGPAVTSTPNGNDFPAGKTRSYTYSRGFDDDRLNHNMLTITDGRGNDPSDARFGGPPRAVNTYAPVTDPNHPDFDRVIRQEWGGDVVDMVYLAESPSAANGGAVRRTIVNDRAGNVSELFFDDGNRLVVHRQFTGRADPRQPTTLASNRPVNRLRATDPAFFETRHEYDADSLLVRTVHPNGNVTEMVHQSAIAAGASPRERGNLRIMRRLPGTHVPAGDQLVLEETYEYDPRLNDCCGLEFVSRLVDPRGNVSTREFDAEGNLVRLVDRIPTVVHDFEWNEHGQLVAHVWPPDAEGRRRRDEQAYHAAGPQRGYLAEIIEDATGLRFVTSHERDAVGNLVRLTDARGHDTQFTRNALDQVVRTTEREVTDGSGIRYRIDTAYDANDNIVRIDVEDRDETGALQPGSPLTTSYSYDALDALVRVEREAGGGRILVTEIERDANRNPTLLRRGEAVAGRQPANVVRMLFDERDLPFRSIRAEGSPLQSSEQADHDANGNLVRVMRGLEDGPRTWTLTRDAYDRVVVAGDPMGNVWTMSHDANGNIVRERLDGELEDVPGAAGNVRLAEVEYGHDALDRLVLERHLRFDPMTQDPVGDGASELAAAWSDRSLIVSLTDDNGHAVQYRHDSVGRVSEVRDAAGNERHLVRNENGAVIRLTEIDRRSDGGPAETFVTTLERDNLDRLVRSTDNVGNVIEQGFDSRSNRTVTRDGLRGGAPGSPGNLVRTSFDGAGRELSMTRFMTSTGTGSGVPVSEIVTSKRWDDSGRLIAEIDDNGRETLYEWDPLDRLAGVVRADGTREAMVRDVHDDVVQSMDPRGTSVSRSFDALGRIARVDVSPGPGVSGDTTLETFVHDGMSRIVRATNDVSVVTRRHDSLSNILREETNGVPVVAAWDGLGNLLELTYPSGRVVTHERDVLDRAIAIRDQSGPIVEQEFVGADRLTRRAFGNGTVASVTHDGLRRILRMTHAGPLGAFDDRMHAWDGMSNALLDDELVGGVRREHSYDSASRLARSVTQEPGGTASLEYQLDGAGNRLAVVGGPDGGAYVRDGLAGGPLDAQVNQDTMTPFDVRSHDANGNLESIDAGLPSERRFSTDYRDRVVRVDVLADGVVARYLYDAFGRRIGEDVSGPAPRSRRWFHAREEIIEERDGMGAVVATHVFADRIDDVLSTRTAAGDWYLHQDRLGSVVRLTDDDGNLAESYRYDDFGAPRFRDDGGSPVASSAAGNRWLFTGRQFDPETDLYHYRARFLDPRAGRFLSRDPMGAWYDPLALGNGTTYAGNNPATLADPWGLMPNRNDAKSVDDYLRAALNWIETGPEVNLDCDCISAAEALASLEEHGKWKYVYTESAGWMDMAHFIKSAHYSSVLRRSGVNAQIASSASLAGGVAVEFIQFGAGLPRLLGIPTFDGTYSSAFTAEDIPSDAAGALFGVEANGWKGASCRTLLDSLRAVLTLMGAKPPEQAPDYDKLPQSEAAWERQANGDGYWKRGWKAAKKWWSGK